jgi:transcriptional regulator GlxA family with amidase domain
VAVPRRIVILAFPNVQPLDVAGPAEVFATAAQYRPGAYEVTVVARDAAPLPTASGYAILPGGDLASAAGRIDTLVVAGGPGTRTAAVDDHLIDWVADAAARSRRVTSVCTGAFLLARADLLDGRRATTHWEWCAELGRRYPAITVEADPIFIADGHIRTSAGVTAGMDLALALVEEDHGHTLALEVARQLVLFMKRPGGQSQFSAQLALQAPERKPLREVQAWALDHLDADLSVAALAGRAYMSPRHFARAFRAETGMTPAVWVEAVRIERARVTLESTVAPVESVARACGFGTPETMRRAFARRVGVSPSAYRTRFAA